MQLANPQPITPAELVQLAKASKGKIRHLYLHWTAGRYKQVFDDYHLSTVMTHQEAAALDGYGPFSGDPQTRWDLWYLPDLPLSAQLKHGGYVLRGKAIWYQLILEQTGAWEKLWADH